VNYLTAPDKDNPYPATFAPGVLDRSKAQIFEIKPGTKLTEVVIQLPNRLTSHKVSGSILAKGKAGE
jgi:hypothetical protein